MEWNTHSQPVLLLFLDLLHPFSLDYFSNLLDLLNREWIDHQKSFLMILNILCKRKPVMTSRLTTDQNCGLVISFLKNLNPKIKRIKSFDMVLKNKKTFRKLSSPIIESPRIVCLTSKFIWNLQCIDFFVYIHQDATPSYLEILFYSIDTFSELQECSSTLLLSI